MEILHVHIQEGFTEDRVQIKINRNTMFDEVVTTHPMRGHAGSFETAVPSGAVNIDVRVISRSLAKVIVIEVTGTVYLGIGLRNDNIEHRISSKPFLYF
jgi:hypothetical protein